MHFGVVLPQFGKFASRDSLTRVAQAAEDQGWDSVWFADHVIIPTPYTARFSETFYELFVTMGFVAAVTSRVRIGTSIVILPYRHPLMTAKQVATLDQLSEGRVILGVAFGWMKEEYDVLGIPFEKRGRRSDECLAAMKECWLSDSPHFEGEFYRFSEIAFSPKPIQKPHPPIWIGGNDRRTLRRVVEYGDAWHPIAGPRIVMNEETLRSRIAELRHLAEENGRKPDEILLSFHAPLAFEGDPGALRENLTFIASPDEILRRLELCRELGFTHFVLNCFYGMPEKIGLAAADHILRTMERFSNEVRPRL